MSSGTPREKNDFKIVASNRKARHEYEILESLEAGLALLGSEVKSLRDGKASFKDAYATAKGNEIYLYNLHIAPYDKSGYAGHDPERPRKLLLHQKEIFRLISSTEIKGLTLIPLRIYFRGKYAKVEIAICRGKRVYDKRKAIADREMKRDMERQFKQNR